MSRYVPTAEAIEACGEACQKFFKFEEEHPLTLNDGEREVHNFNAGFHRGVAWYQSKFKLPPEIIGVGVPNPRPK